MSDIHWRRLATRVRARLKYARSDEEVDLRYVVDEQIRALTRALSRKATPAPSAESTRRNGEEH